MKTLVEFDLWYSSYKKAKACAPTTREIFEFFRDNMANGVAKSERDAKAAPDKADAIASVPSEEDFTEFFNWYYADKRGPKEIYDKLKANTERTNALNSTKIEANGASNSTGRASLEGFKK